MSTSQNRFLPGVVSTIIPVYNRSTMLKQAVASVLQQTYKAIEIIIVNDGSTDNTGHVADLLAEENPETVKVLHISNGGPGLAREAGRQIARGEYTQYLDSDDLLLDRKFEIQVSALQNHNECGVAYGITQLIDEHGNLLNSSYKWTGKRIDYLFPSLLVDRWWSTHTPLYRRSVCDAVGPWSNMRMAEDWDYDARVGALGVRLFFCNEHVSQHRQHQQPRLTGQALSDGVIRDFGRLIVRLFECSQELGLSNDCVEMKHFSRWAFLTSRRAGSVGQKIAAHSCMDIALSCAGREPETKLKIYVAAVSLLGSRIPGIIAMKLDQIVRPEPSDATINLSWKNDIDS